LYRIYPVWIAAANHGHVIFSSREGQSPNLAPSSSIASFTSIFTQLQQRLKEQDRETQHVASKDADTQKSSDDDKNKKKSVKWKTGDDLVRVHIIEWVEPEGDYYGGGRGTAQRGDRTGEAEAPRSRNSTMIEWYQPKREFTL
jgi:hypothetical protein